MDIVMVLAFIFVFSVRPINSLHGSGLVGDTILINISQIGNLESVDQNPLLCLTLAVLSHPASKGSKYKCQNFSGAEPKLKRTI